MLSKSVQYIRKVALILTHLSHTVGKTSNYAVVMAQLIIDDKKYGMHSFMCQLRDLETHEPMSGEYTAGVM